MNDTPEQRRTKANEARQLLDNEHFKDAFAAVEGYLQAQAQACDPDDKDKAQRIILCMQLLRAVEREVSRKLDDGVMAEVEIEALEAKRRGGILRFIR